MKKSIKTTAIIATMGIMIVLSYWLGATETGMIRNIQKISGDKKTVLEILLDGFLDIGSLNLEDHFVDINQVVDFDVNEYGLQLYFEDGTGYWWER